MCDLDKLAEKWQQCWYGLGLDLLEINRVFQQLVNAYTQPDRHYHNLTHIEQVLTTLDRFSLTLNDPIAVYLAGWFHDFIYDSQALDNELQSAKAASELLANLGIATATIDRVRSLILVTQGHQIVANDYDLSVLLDADLAIFGADSLQYQAYQRSIRSEYSWVADVAYRAGRIQLLESFLGRNRLYHTDLLFNELESIAQNNITSEILQLKLARSVYLPLNNDN